MNIIIVGLGKVGRKLAERLSAEKEHSADPQPAKANVPHEKTRNVQRILLIDRACMRIIGASILQVQANCYKEVPHYVPQAVLFRAGPVLRSEPVLLCLR